MSFLQKNANNFINNTGTIGIWDKIKLIKELDIKCQKLFRGKQNSKERTHWGVGDGDFTK